MPGYQPRPLRLRETAVAAPALHASLLWTGDQPRPLCLRKAAVAVQPKAMGRSQRPSRAHSAYAKWPLPACHLWQRPRAEAWLAQGQANRVWRAARGLSL